MTSTLVRATPEEVVAWIRENLLASDAWLRNLQKARQWADNPSREGWEQLSAKEARTLLEFARLPQPEKANRRSPQALADSLDERLDGGTDRENQRIRVNQWAHSAASTVGAEAVPTILRYVALCRNWRH